MRKLVTARQVSEIHPIDGADAIELAKIDGWQCVVKKGEFSEGDTCLYFEVDSFLPETDERFAFLAGRGTQTNGDGSKGFRLRTIRLRGQLSQGLALPASAFSGIDLMDGDLAEKLGVSKYERALPAQLAGQAKGIFPAFLQKTDQERIQNMPWIINDPNEWEVTQKLDGSSCSIFWNAGEFGVCSRNLELKETEGNSFWEAANRYEMRRRLNELGMNICLQGELIGPGIQGNPHNLPRVDFRLFDIFLIDQYEYATPPYRGVLMDRAPLHGIPRVPLVEYVHLNAFGSVAEILEYADVVPDVLNAKNPAPEGVVFKRMDGLASFKAISNKYLLREK